MTNPIGHFSFVELTITWSLWLSREIVHSIPKGWIFILCKILDGQNLKPKFLLELSARLLLSTIFITLIPYWCYVEFAYFVCLASLGDITEILLVTRLEFTREESRKKNEKHL
ncbi:hypothetical protein VNO77_04579 [Canavalia gladiata]|uniref:Uncharacterized protein n=1 Tax=Canavalia gladiata TaxID=3824 RepID=A0AAN9R4W7_CANGL